MHPTEADRAAMLDALAHARTAAERGDVPVGAIVFDPAGVAVAAAANDREHSADPTGHAEILAIRLAARSRQTWNLAGCTLVVTLEPCIMCAGAILQSRISRVVFGAWDDKAGAAGSQYDVLRDRRLPHLVEVIAGVEAEGSARMLGEFFAQRRSVADGRDAHLRN